MNTDRNTIWVGLAVVLVIVGGVFLSQRLRKRNLPTGNMTQASPTPTAGTSESPIPGKPQVKITTSKGDIVIELRPDVAPKTVANYLGLWSRGECNGRTWHRVEDWVVQGCDPKGDGTGGNTTLPTETSSESFTAGAVGVARLPANKDVSNDSQFFIVKKDATNLNGDYTYFGRVISGMDVVDKLAVGDKIVSTLTLSK